MSSDNTHPASLAQRCLFPNSVIGESTGLYLLDIGNQTISHSVDSDHAVVYVCITHGANNTYVVKPVFNTGDIVDNSVAVVTLLTPSTKTPEGKQQATNEIKKVRPEILETSDTIIPSYTEETFPKVQSSLISEMSVPLGEVQEYSSRTYVNVVSGKRIPYETDDFVKVRIQKTHNGRFTASSHLEWPQMELPDELEEVWEFAFPDNVNPDRFSQLTREPLSIPEEVIQEHVRLALDSFAHALHEDINVVSPGQRPMEKKVAPKLSFAGKSGISVKGISHKADVPQDPSEEEETTTSEDLQSQPRTKFKMGSSLKTSSTSIKPSAKKTSTAKVVATSNENFSELIDKVRSDKKCPLYSRDNIEKFVNRMSGAISKYSDDIGTSHEGMKDKRESLDIAKCIGSTTFLKSKSPNVTVTFEEWPQTLEDVDNMEIRENFGDAFCMTMTNTDLSKKLELTTAPQKRAFVAELCREIVREVIRVYGEGDDDPVLTQERSQALFFKDGGDDAPRVTPHVQSAVTGSFKASENRWNRMKVGLTEAQEADVQDEDGSRGRGTDSKFSKPNFAKSSGSGSSAKSTTPSASSASTFSSKTKMKLGAGAGAKKPVVHEVIREEMMEIREDLYDYPLDELSALKPFHFFHRKLKAALVEVSDADTYEVVAKIPISDFTSAHRMTPKGIKRIEEKTCFMDGPCDTQRSLVFNFKIRGANYDAAEKYTRQGLILKKALMKLVPILFSNRVPVSIDLEGSQTYDRIVGRLFINGTALDDVLKLLTWEERPMVHHKDDGYDGNKSDFSSQFDENLKVHEQKEYLESPECDDASAQVLETICKEFNIPSTIAETSVELTENPSATANEMLNEEELGESKPAAFKFSKTKIAARPSAGVKKVEKEETYEFEPQDSETTAAPVKPKMGLKLGMKSAVPAKEVKEAKVGANPYSSGGRLKLGAKTTESKVKVEIEDEDEAEPVKEPTKPTRIVLGKKPETSMASKSSKLSFGRKASGPVIEEDDETQEPVTAAPSKGRFSMGLGRKSFKIQEDDEISPKREEIPKTSLRKAAIVMEEDDESVRGASDSDSNDGGLFGHINDGDDDEF